MNKIVFKWYKGKAGALTTSWDDATIYDKPLIDILNANKIKGTFNLNSSQFGDKSRKGQERIEADEVKALYEGHEVACHGVTHPFLEQLADDQIHAELLEDRRNLERLVGYPVRGLALPYGTWDNRVLRIAKECGIVYSRPTTQHNGFSLPRDFMDWQTTGHHKSNIAALWDKFIEYSMAAKLFYLWGHSYEFNRDNNWDIIKDFAGKAGKDKNTWFATNMEVYDYVTAWRNLQFSVDIDCVRNISHVTLWYGYDGKTRSIKPGEIQKIG
jgi:peptidoglycan/xylan/chitin deacetylase (PgdA/CDA1 family)